MTNYEKIKAMSVEEMAKLVEGLSFVSCLFPDQRCNGRVCFECCCEWLLQEAEE